MPGGGSLPAALPNQARKWDTVESSGAAGSTTDENGAASIPSFLPLAKHRHVGRPGQQTKRQQQKNRLSRRHLLLTSPWRPLPI